LVVMPMTTYTAFLSGPRVMERRLDMQSGIHTFRGIYLLRAFIFFFG
jgi:hypothetical protein